MTRILPVFLLLGSLAGCVRGEATSPAKVDVSGSWFLQEQISDEIQIRRMSLQVSRSNKITGQVGSSKIEGDISDSGITLKTLTSGGRVIATYEGQAAGGDFTGKGNWGDLKMKWTA